MLELTKERVECLLEMQKLLAPALERVKKAAEKALDHFYKLDDVDRVHITPVGVQIDFEYNDACNCHPEYRHAHEELSWDVLDMEEAEIYTYIFEREKSVRAAAQKADDEIRAERLKKLAKEEADREKAQYEMLKKKYEQPPQVTPCASQ